MMARYTRALSGGWRLVNSRESGSGSVRNMLGNKIRKIMLAILIVSTVLFFVPPKPPLALADLTCGNSDYNCIYVDTVNGNRIVCSRSVCGSGSFGGRTYRLEGLYAFDGDNPNTANTSTTATTTIEVGGSSTSSTTTVASAINPCLDPANPNYQCGWAVLGVNNVVTNAIVCTFAVCGSGSFGGNRVVLQGQQSSDGNVAGWHGPEVIYNDSSQVFSLPAGGTFKSGGKLEDAVFPTTTTTTIGSTTSSSSLSSPSSNLGGSTQTTAVPSGEVRASVGGVEVEAETTVGKNAVTVSVGEVEAEISNKGATDDSTNTEAQQGLVLSSGESADVSIDGLQPNSEVEVVIYSTPRNLGSLQVNEFGELVASIEIPSNMESGSHTLVLKGLDKFGKQIELKFGLVVYSPDAYIPIWVWFLIGLLFILLALSFVSRRSKKGMITT